VSLPVSRSDQSTYRQDIDGLRAVAVLSVLMFHTTPMLVPGGFVGVDIFFVVPDF
jgi:peptidoglycan/LPS O-acetylase OafA/YrhL